MEGDEGIKGRFAKIGQRYIAKIGKLKIPECPKNADFLFEMKWIVFYQSWERVNWDIFADRNSGGNPHAWGQQAEPAKLAELAAT